MFQVKIIWCKNGECESCEKQKPIALAILNQDPETKNIDFDEQNQSKSNLNKIKAYKYTILFLKTRKSLDILKI